MKKFLKGRLLFALGAIVNLNASPRNHGLLSDEVSPMDSVSIDSRSIDTKAYEQAEAHSEFLKEANKKRFKMESAMAALKAVDAFLTFNTDKSEDLIKNGMPVLTLQNEVSSLNTAANVKPYAVTSFEVVGDGVMLMLQYVYQDLSDQKIKSKEITQKLGKDWNMYVSRLRVDSGVLFRIYFISKDSSRSFIINVAEDNLRNKAMSAADSIMDDISDLHGAKVNNKLTALSKILPYADHLTVRNNVVATATGCEAKAGNILHDLNLSLRSITGPKALKAALSPEICEKMNRESSKIWKLSKSDDFIKRVSVEVKDMRQKGKTKVRGIALDRFAESDFLKKVQKSDNRVSSYVDKLAAHRLKRERLAGTAEAQELANNPALATNPTAVNDLHNKFEERRNNDPYYDPKPTKAKSGGLCGCC